MNKTNKSKISWMLVLRFGFSAWLLLASAAGWWWWRESGTPWRKLPPSVRVEYAMQSIQSEARTFASPQTYRLIENRHDGMTYAPATQESTDHTLVSASACDSLALSLLKCAHPVRCGSDDRPTTQVAG